MSERDRLLLIFSRSRDNVGACIARVGSKVSFSCLCIRLQAVVLAVIYPEPVLIDEPARMAATMRDVMERRPLFGLGWMFCNRSKHASLAYLNNKGKCYSVTQLSKAFPQ